jgi:hypothetical protein
LNSTDEVGAVELRRKKNIVGIVAIVLLVVFTFLALFGILSGWGWVIADLIVAAVANLILRRIGRPKEL